MSLRHEVWSVIVLRAVAKQTTLPKSLFFTAGGAELMLKSVSGVIATGSGVAVAVSRDYAKCSKACI